MAVVVCRRNGSYQTLPLVLTLVGSMVQRALADMDSLSLLQTNVFASDVDSTLLAFEDLTASGSEQRALDEEFQSIAAKIDKQGINRPLIVVSDGCSGSSVVVDVAKRLLENSSIRVMHSRNELYTKRKNPMADELGIGRSFVALARSATENGEMLVFKVPASWMIGHPMATKWLLRLGPNVVVNLRQNVLDHLVCKVRDCFDRKTGRSVTEDGKESSLCFNRRKRDDVNVMAKMRPDRLLLEMRRKLKEYQSIPTTLKRYGFGEVKVFYSEQLLAYEMDGTELQASVDQWKRFMNELGVELPRATISTFLAARSGVSHPPAPHQRVIYDAEEVEDRLRVDSELYAYWRKDGDKQQHAQTRRRSHLLVEPSAGKEPADVGTLLMAKDIADAGKEGQAELR